MKTIARWILRDEIDDPKRRAVNSKRLEELSDDARRDLVETVRFLRGENEGLAKLLIKVRERIARFKTDRVARAPNLP